MGLLSSEPFGDLVQPLSGKISDLLHFRHPTGLALDMLNQP